MSLCLIAFFKNKYKDKENKELRIIYLLNKKLLLLILLSISYNFTLTKIYIIFNFLYIIFVCGKIGIMNLIY